MKRKCGIDGCNSNHSAKGLCNRHYLIILRAGGFEATIKHTPKNTDIIDRLLSAITIDKENSCWNWNLAITQTIPKIRYRGKTHTAYRLSYEVFIGKIPDEFTIDHLCENRSCINPFHLEAVTRSENTKRYHQNRRIEKARALC